MRRVKATPGRGRQRDAARTRGDLVRAGAEIFNRDGYYGTDTNRIAAAAGYAPATFYKHFPDKRALFLHAYDLWVASEWETIDTIVAESKGTELVERIVRAVMAHHRRWAGFRISLVALAAVDPEVAAFRVERRRKQVRLFGDALERLGGVKPSAGRTLAVLLTFERLCDAAATGEARALGVTPRDIAAELHTVLANVMAAAR